MGNQLYCCNRTVNNNKNKEKEEEIINNMQEDYIIITKNNNNFEEFDIPEINPELPLDFPYSKDYFNGDDTQKEFLLNDISILPYINLILLDRSFPITSFFSFLKCVHESICITYYFNSFIFQLYHTTFLKIEEVYTLVAYY